MMYLVKNGDNYLVNASDIETIRKYGGDSAKIILSWDEEKQDESLKAYFSDMKIDPELLELYVIAGVQKAYLNKCVDKFYEENMSMIKILTDVEVITPREQDELIDINDVSKKKQLELVNKYYKKK